MDKLDYYRKKIDAIDRGIVKLLLSRFRIAMLIASYKKNEKMGITDRKRELEVIKNIRKYSGKKHRNIMSYVFKDIMAYSKKLQK